MPGEFCRSDDLEVPSADVKLRPLVPLAIAAVALCGASSVWADQLGREIPEQCVAHTAFDGGPPDVPGDYRCAGVAIQFHTNGVASSPFPIWAGQWLFTDDEGEYRVGTCTFNRGMHPAAATASNAVTQPFPNDPTGAKSAYLMWRYGDSTDALTAAAMWAVFHFYAADAAGTNRSVDGAAPLIPRLDVIAADSGREDVQQRAIALDDEATSMSGAWRLDAEIDVDGVVTVSLFAGDVPVPGQEISVLVSGVDTPLVATTGTDGTATVAVLLPSGTATVVATAAAPGQVLVYRGTPAAPDPHGAQTLVTAGPPAVLRAVVELAVPPPTTVPPTTVPPTTVPPTTVPPTTVPPTTVPPVTTVPPTTVTIPPTVPPVVQSPAPLPRTGGAGDGGVAQLATAFLVGGVGLLGTLRRRGTGRLHSQG